MLLQSMKYLINSEGSNIMLLTVSMPPFFPFSRILLPPLDGLSPIRTDLEWCCEDIPLMNMLPKHKIMKPHFELTVLSLTLTEIKQKLVNF